MLHNFNTDYPDLSLLGVPRIPILALEATPNLHLYPVTLVTHDAVAFLPLPRVFNWHYYQYGLVHHSTRIFLISIFFVYPFKTVADILG